jgi:hypothetical protein
MKTFRIDPLSGRLSLNTPLDYEHKRSYEFELTCSDSGEAVKLSTTSKVIVNVLDLNDNAPLFKKKTDRVAYIESKFKKGLAIYKVQAFDLDPSEQFSQTTYHLKSIFSANNSTRVYTKEDSLLNSFSLAEDDSSAVGLERLITSFRAFDLDGSVPNLAIEYTMDTMESVELPSAQYGGKESIGKAGFKLAKLNDDMGLFKLG